MGSRRYDSRTTIFSPEGRLYQVEYALESISMAGTCIAIMNPKHGIVLLAERKITSKLLEQDNDNDMEKIYKLDDHILVGVAGLTSDAESLIDTARIHAQQYLKTYGDQIPIENLVRRISDIKQGYTQYGGMRPFGVSFLYAGYDELKGFQLYTSNPSGNYSSWKAISIGSNTQSAQTLLQMDYKEDMTLDECIQLSLKTLSKTTDSSSKLTSDRIEISTISKDLVTINGVEKEKVNLKIYTNKEIEKMLKEHKVNEKNEDDEEEEEEEEEEDESME